jgi:hypothetical protein
MKLTIIASTSGQILGTARYIETEAGPSQGGIIPDAGQLVQEVEVPDEFADLSADELHRRLKETLPDLPKVPGFPTD